MTAVVTSDPTLTALCDAVRADPGDRRGWLVLGDLLSSRGDPHAGWVHAVLDDAPIPPELAHAVGEPDEDLLYWHDRVRPGLSLGWDLDRSSPADALSAMRDRPAGWSLVLVDRVTPGGPPRPSTLGRACDAIVDAVVARITRAFDGVPPPDEDHRTLYQAEAADNYAACDRSRDHFGRWQDLPHAHLVDNQWALSHLDEQGIRYYLPAVMCAELRGYLDRWVAGGGEGLWIYESLSYTLRPGQGPHLRDYACGRTSLLDREQRAAICAFALVTLNEEAFQAWARVVAAERDGAEGDGPVPGWFDRFWPL